MWAGVTFETRATGSTNAPQRTDIAAFVGFVSLRPGPVPASVLATWERMGWSATGPHPLPILLESPGSLEWLDSWVTTPEGLRWEGYLTGAVRDFFRQGGRRCWVIPAGPPRAPTEDPVEVAEGLDALLPGSFGGPEATPALRETWRGVAQLLDLPEVALLLLPDLPAVVGARPSVSPSTPAEPLPVPQFVECTTPPPLPPAVRVHRVGPPRLAPEDWDLWQQAVHSAVRWLQRHRPDVQLVAALPLGLTGSREELDPLPALLQSGRLAPLEDDGLGTAWLQLAFPWLETDTSTDRLGGLAPPDGLVAGLLARNALARGTFRSAIHSRPEGVRKLVPRLDRKATWQAHPVDLASAQTRALPDRLTLVGQTPQGIRLLSDSTTSLDPSWRQGAVSRLVGVVRREVVRVGEATVFGHNGPATWKTVRQALSGTLRAIQQAGGLHPEGGFEVHCGPQTMSQQDLDSGRLIARVLFRPLQAIEHLTVVLSLVGGATDVRVQGGS
jgi:hypothetical protein